MAKTITYNSFSFQDSDFLTQDIIYRNMPAKVIDLEPLARRDGFRIVNTYYDSKVITISGLLTKDTETNLRTSIDSMKEALSINEANLDITDGAATIRYVATVESIDMPEEHYHITSIPYRISFKCQPFGKATSATTTTNSFSTTPYSNSINPTGSANAYPKLKWTCTTAPTAAITQIDFINSSTNDSISVTSLAMDANGDYLEVDTDAMTVKVSHDSGPAAEVDFSGVFPLFYSNTNSYTVSVTCAGTFALRQDFIYYPAYL